MSRWLSPGVVKWVGCFGMVAVVAWLACPVLGAENAQPAAEKPAAKERKKSGARLPMYYAQVVSKEQREQITAILEEYAPKLDALKAQMDAMTKERDEKVSGVLTREQDKKIKDLKAEAQTKRQAGKEAKGQKPAKEPAPGDGSKKPAKSAKPAAEPEPAK
jgi:hypothetical protein